MRFETRRVLEKDVTKGVIVPYSAAEHDLEANGKIFYLTKIEFISLWEP